MTPPCLVHVRSHLISLHDLSIDPGNVKQEIKPGLWKKPHLVYDRWYTNIGNRIVIKQNTYIYKCSIFAFQPSVLNPHKAFWISHMDDMKTLRRLKWMEDGALVKEWMLSYYICKL